MGYDRAKLAPRGSQRSRYAHEATTPPILETIRRRIRRARGLRHRAKPTDAPGARDCRLCRRRCVGHCGPADRHGFNARLGHSFVIENRPGAASNLATETVVHAPPDGHTLLLVSASNAINATLYDKLNYSFIRDIAPVGIHHPRATGDAGQSIVSATTAAESIAHAKANPGQYQHGIGGRGSPQHLAGEMFSAMAGIKMLHVPYRGAPPALTDLIGGQVQVYFGSTSGAISYVRSGQLCALAVTSAARSEALPDTPAVSEFVPGYEATTWYGFGAPKGTSAAISKSSTRRSTPLSAMPSSSPHGRAGRHCASRLAS